MLTSLKETFLSMNDFSVVTQNDTATPQEEIAALRRRVEELCALLPAIRAEAAALLGQPDPSPRRPATAKP